jgi:8-oxo-dGTP pyrophosphatase MutT (NUDIX family)
MKKMIIKAGGGIVVNEQNEVLLIYRRGKWDLPKGKLDDGETIEECALREVKEETGLFKIKIEGFISQTKHLYEWEGATIEKITDWYLMSHAGLEAATPQTEEDIEEILWCPKNQLEQYINETYENIRLLFKNLGWIK